MLFSARVIKKPKGNGISPEGCKKIGANLVFFVGFVGLPTLLLLHIYIFLWHLSAHFSHY
jgi:hypothetical protein